MAVSLVVNGTSYSYPNTSNEGWGDSATNWATAVTSGMLQKSGGTFTLTADANFGGSFGLLAKYFTSVSSNAATSGVVRFANAEGIAWRNAANSGNISLVVDSSNNLIYNGGQIGGTLLTTFGGTGLTSYTAGDMVYYASGTAFSKLGIAVADRVVTSSGTAPQWALLVNANIDAAAAIARSKIASGTADHVVINSGAGALSSEATLAVTRGGTNLASYTTGDLLYASGATTLAKRAIGSGVQILKIVAGVPNWAAYVIAISASKTTTYAVLAADDFVQFDATGGAFTATLPTAVGADGKVYCLKKTDSSFNAVTIATTSSQTIDGVTTTLLSTQYEELTVVSDGANWQVIARKNDTLWISYTPTGAWSTNTTYTAKYRRQGPNLQVQAKVALAGAPTSASFTMAIPSGLTIDTASMVATVDVTILGMGAALDNGAGAYPLYVSYNNTTTVVLKSFSSSPVTYAAVTQAAPFTFGNTDEIQLSFQVPIVGWS